MNWQTGKRHGRSREDDVGCETSVKIIIGENEKVWKLEIDGRHFTAQPTDKLPPKIRSTTALT